jgi:RNA polymerase sigma factor (sigma-70 family)
MAATHQLVRPAPRGSDERLARRATLGDRQALGEIFERYQQELYRFCLGLLGEPQDAQDALQNTMVKVLRALPGEKREIALRPWLYRVAHNEAIDLRRAKRDTEALDRHLLDEHSNVPERVEQRERLGWLFQDLGDLPQRQRAVLVMRELSGLDFADIGATLGTSGAVVRQALYEARRNLEQMDFGRGMRCEAVTRVLSDADGRISSRREIRAHLRGCPDCRRFQDRIEARKAAFAGIAPLPVGVAAGLQSALAGAGGSVTGGGVAAALGGGAASTVGTAGVLKAVATVAAMAVLGTAVVGRSPQDQRSPRDAASAPFSRRGHAAHARPSGAGPRPPRAVSPPAHHASTPPAPGGESAPSPAIGRDRAGVPAAYDRATDPPGRAPGSDFSAPAPPAGKPRSPEGMAPKPAQAPPRDEKQAKSGEKHEEKTAKAEAKAEKQEEKAAKAEAKSKEHPPHPAHHAHPPRPAPSQDPVGVPAAPEEGSGETETAPAAAGSPESTSHSPNGKAKGHEKRLAD